MKKIVAAGSLNLDMVVDVDHCPSTGETILTDKLELIPGGKGANQAFAASRLGAETAMIGAVGNDGNGELLIRNLQSAGVNTAGVIKKDGCNTGIAFIQVNRKGDNCITVVSGANARVTREDIDAHMHLIEEADIVLLQFEIPLDTVCYAAEKAKRLGKLVILDPAPTPPALPDELYEFADIIKPNETELEGLTGMDITEETLPSAAAKLRGKGVKHVLVTLGEKGVYLDSETYGTLRLPAFQVEAVDTTAAGDTFTAAIAVKLAMGETLPEAVKFANLVSSIVVTRKGAQSSIPTLEEVRRMM